MDKIPNLDIYFYITQITIIDNTNILWHDIFSTGLHSKDNV